MHEEELRKLEHRWHKLFERGKAGYFNDFQPFLGYFAAFFIIIIVGVFNSVSLWNGQNISLKATSAFVSVSSIPDPMFL